MERDHVHETLQESRRLGVKEYYYTGGEPFMHREMVGILSDTLAIGPATVLTNGTLLPGRKVKALSAAAAASLYSLEFRVSLDGVTREMNDAIRGDGAFDRCLEGVARLVAAGFLPIITTMQSWPEADTPGLLADFHALLSGLGYWRPRIKILPQLKIGAEAERSGGYEAFEHVTHEMLCGYDLSQLICSSARLVTADGVYACPILLDFPSARLGDTLREAIATPAPLGEQACYTCYRHGAICSNMPASGQDLY